MARVDYLTGLLIGDDLVAFVPVLVDDADFIAHPIVGAEYVGLWRYCLRGFRLDGKAPSWTSYER